MRRRPWVLVVALLILALSFSVLVGVRYLNRSNRLRNELLQTFSALPGSLTIGAATLESSTLRLSNIHYRSPDASIEVTIRRISLRLALSNLVRRTGGIERIIQSVVISEPSVSIRADMLLHQPTVSQTLPDLKTFTFLERIILRDGVLRVKGKSDEPWVEVGGLAGWVVAEPHHLYNFELAANSPQDTTSRLSLNGTADLGNNTLSSRFDLNSYSLANLHLPPDSPISDLGGELELHARATYDSMGFAYTGNWKLNQGRLLVDKGPEFDSIHLTGLVEEGLATADGSLRFEGDETELHVSANLNAPLEIAAEAIVPQGRLGRHLGTFARLKEEEQPQGLLQARFNFHSRSGEGWSLTGYGTSPSMKTPIGEFLDLEARVHWDHEEKSILFDYLDATWFGLSTHASGRFNFGREDRFPVDVAVKGVVDPSALPDWTHPLANKDVNGDVTIRLHPLEGWDIRTEGRVRNADDPALGEFSGLYNRIGFDLNLDLYSSRQQDASIKMWGKHKQTVHVRTEQPQVIAGWWTEDFLLSERLLKLDVHAEAHFQKERFFGGIALFDPKTGFSLNSNGSVHHQPGKPVQGVFAYSFLRNDAMIGNGDGEFTLKDSLLVVERLTFMDFLHGFGSVNLAQRTIERFELAVEDLDVSDLIPAMTSLQREKVDGRINGRLLVSGPFKQPVIQSHFEMSAGRFGELDQYWGLLTVESDVQGNVVIQQGAVGRAGRTLLTMDGGYSIPQHKLDIAVSSPGSDARVLSQALTGRENLLQGTLSLAGRIGGSLTLPNWTMNVGMRDARVMGIRFTDVSLALHGESTKRLGHVLYVDEFDLHRPDHYRFQVFGAVPLSRGAGQLSFLLDGDLPELLPQMTGFVRSGEGEGELNWIVTMVGGKPVSSQGNLKLENGSLTFTSVFPEMRNINIDVDIDMEGLTTINQFEARLGQDSRRIIVTNEPGDPDNPEKLPIHVRSLGLDLGVLKIQTPHSEGIPMRPPVVSRTPEYANVKLSGLNEKQWFQVSGPLDSVRVEGEVTISKAVFTLPTDSDKRTVVRDPGGAAGFAKRNLRGLLLGARWNAELNIRRDVSFDWVIGEIENISLLNAFNILGQVSVDLNLESTEPTRPLRVMGRLEDNSFRMVGTITSTQGQIEFLDLEFEMQRAEVTFDQTSLLPVVSARAVSNVLEPGTDFSRRVYLTLYVIDPVTGERTTRGRWGEFTLVLEDEEGSSQEQVASTLGISPTAIRDRATMIGAGGLEKAVTRRWLRPIERDVEKWLGLDLVRIDPTIAQNLATDQPGLTNQPEDTVQVKGRQAVDYFRASSVTVGKYLTRDLFLSYTGQLGKDPRYTTVPEYQSGRISLLQTWSLQYRLSEISPNFVIQGDWEYDNLADVPTSDDPRNLQNNRSIRLKYTFVFDVTKLKWP